MPDRTTDALKFDATTHFGFGKNWAAYSRTVTEDDIQNAVREMQRLFGRDDLAGARFLDIGCGSGIHTLAALRLGAASVTAVDFDEKSVATASTLVGQWWTGSKPLIRQGNVFELTPAECGRFDIVYSWGVLHHTGDMWTALDRAAALVDDGGTLAIALYRKTPMCGFWRWEKRRFTHGGALFRGSAIGLFVAARFVRDVARLKNPFTKIGAHNRKRGMKWYIDVLDWLGGYPYESARPEDVVARLEAAGFRLKQMFKARRDLGILGSGNAEYVFEKRPPAEAAFKTP
ncbi:MAG TPA: class I SAM-dependent methyltransferase [Rhodospirillales bacterium]|nr:class I SAM-dependent methyltransferase [Rhodospirillales bacterium]